MVCLVVVLAAVLKVQVLAEMENLWFCCPLGDELKDS